jgi:hypothetical protein
VALTSFEKGKLRIAAHVREELERASIPFEAIQCRSGGLHTPADITRLIITVNEAPACLDLTSFEVEDCELMVAGETWHKIAGFINTLK